MKLSPTEAVVVVEVRGALALVLTMDELQIIADEMRHGHKTVYRPETTKKPQAVRHTSC